MRTNVYVDGFNLYYRSLKGTAYKWLDLAGLAKVLLPSHHQLNKIRYFTARVSARPTDAGAQERQVVYLRALRSIPGLTIHYGNFLSKPKKLPLVDGNGQVTNRFKVVMVTEEKGSDVNLASYLLLDAFRDDYDAALVVSNDSDLITPIEIAMHEFGKRIIVAITDPEAPRSALPASAYRRIREGNLSASQLAAVISDGNREIRKPASW